MDTEGGDVGLIGDDVGLIGDDVGLIGDDVGLIGDVVGVEQHFEPHQFIKISIIP